MTELGIPKSGRRRDSCRNGDVMMELLVSIMPDEGQVNSDAGERLLDGLSD